MVILPADPMNLKTENGLLAIQWGISSKFPLTNHLALPGSESVFGISQGPPMCACASLSQDGFTMR